MGKFEQGTKDHVFETVQPSERFIDIALAAINTYGLKKDQRLSRNKSVFWAQWTHTDSRYELEIRNHRQTRSNYLLSRYALHSPGGVPTAQYLVQDRGGSDVSPILRVDPDTHTITRESGTHRAAYEALAILAVAHPEAADIALDQAFAARFREAAGTIVVSDLEVERRLLELDRSHLGVDEWNESIDNTVDYAIDQHERLKNRIEEQAIILARSSEEMYAVLDRPVANEHGDFHFVDLTEPTTDAAIELMNGGARLYDLKLDTRIKYHLGNVVHRNMDILRQCSRRVSTAILRRLGRIPWAEH
jgi:hypothetical protein